MPYLFFPRYMHFMLFSFHCPNINFFNLIKWINADYVWPIEFDLGSLKVAQYWQPKIWDEGQEKDLCL